MSMNVNAMRTVDYFVGVPLTFFITLLKPLLPSRASSQIKNVLFIELSEMGSAILADPALEKAKAHGSHLFFVIFKRNKPSLDLLKTVPQENIFVIRDDNLIYFAIDSLRFILWCQNKKIDACIDLELFSRATSVLNFISRAKHRVGFYNFHNEGLYRGRLLTHEVSYNPYLHISKNFVALVEGLFNKDTDLPLLKETIADKDVILKQAQIPDATKTLVRDQIKILAPSFDFSNEIILINPGVGDFLPQRKWPEGHFVHLINLILENHPNCLILLTGTKDEFTTNQNLAQKINHPKVINFSGRVSLTELLALYDLAKILVTSDSGPAHFSSTTGIRSFVLYGPETPALYGPLGKSATTFYAGLACSPCVSATNHRKTPCTNNKCLQIIQPQSVYEKIKPELRA